MPESFFDHLPSATTQECRRCLDAFVETTDFVFLVTQVVTQQDHARRVAAEALLFGAEPDKAADLQRQLDEGDAFTKRLRRFSQLVFQMLITRGVDNYLTYVSDLLSTVFRTRPETLRSSEQVRLEFVLQHDSMDDLVDALAERRVERLAYSGMRELAGNLRDALGFDLFDSEDGLSRAVEIIENRNLIVHNRAVVNRTYLKRVSTDDAQLGDTLTFDFEQTFAQVEFLAESAIAADARAVAKWGLPVVERES